MTTVEVPPLLESVPALSFAIQRKKAWLDGRTLSEYHPDLKRFIAYKMLPNETTESRSEKHLKQLSGSGRACYSSVKEHVDMYYRAMRRDKKIKETTMGRAKHGWGRAYPSGNLSIATLERFARNTIIDDVYYDFDIVNAQPMMCLNVCNDEGCLKKVPTIVRYCENRDAVLADGMAKYGKSRDEVKAVYNKVMNGGKIPEWYAENRDIQKFKSECEFVREKVREVNPELFSSARMKNAGDKEIPEGQRMGKNMRTMFSFWCAELEFQYVSAVMEWCESEGLMTRDGLQRYTIAGYTYDGVVLLREVVDAYCKKRGITLGELCEDLAQIGMDRTGHDLTWKVKTTDEKHDISEQYATCVAEVPTNIPSPNGMNFSQYVAEWEKTNAFIRRCGMYVETGREGDFMLRDIASLKASNQHLCVVDPESGKNLNFIKMWTQNNNDIRCYENMDVYPFAPACPHDCFNLWTPFEMERVENWSDKPDVLSKFIYHVREVVCGTTQSSKYQEGFEYLLDWLSHIIQRPHIKSGKCPVLISQQGSGKGTLIKILSRILGEKKVFQSVKPEKDVYGDFNPMMEKAMIVNIDEPECAKTEAFESTIKNFITEPTMVINDKFVKSHVIKSYHRFIFTTNKADGGIKVEEGDRRFFILRMSDKHKGDMKYWDEWEKILSDPDPSGFKTIYDWLARRDIGDFMQKATPKTVYQKNLERSNRTPLECWLEHLVRTWMIDGGGDDKRVLTMTGTEALAVYLDFCETQGIPLKNYKTSAGGLSQLISNHDVGRFATGDVYATRKMRGGDANKREFRLDVLFEWLANQGVMTKEDFSGGVEGLENEEVVNLSETTNQAPRKMKIRAKRAEAEMHLE
jgi:energy-coupling factor transporter ATP-binding protein EcfA2